MKISNDLTDEEISSICNIALVINCNCPSYLIQILQQLRKFQSYLNECVEQFPQDVENHRWLETQVAQMEAFLRQTILDFLQREALLDENNHLHLHALMERMYSGLMRDSQDPQEMAMLLELESKISQYKNSH